MTPAAICLLSLLSVLTPVSTQAYKIQYNDCLEPSTVKAYDLHNACNYRQHDNSTNLETYYLLQKKEESEVVGFSCHLQRSSFTMYCGSFSHSKLMEVPDIDLPLSIDPAKCLDIVNRQVFDTPDGATHSVVIGAENVYKSMDYGAIHVSDDAVSCTGQQMRIGSQLVSDSLRVSQYKLLVKKEYFTIYKGRIEVISDHIRLPSKCALGARGCQTVFTTYVWDIIKESCSLEIVRTLNVIEDGPYLIDHNNKIILQRLGTDRPPSGCNNPVIFRTEYHNIFLSKAKNNFQQMTTDVDLAHYVAARDDYIMWTLEHSTSGQRQHAHRQLCQRSLQNAGQNIIAMGGDRFMRRNGDTVEHLTCPRKEAEVREDLDICYNLVPVTTDDGPAFVQPATRLLTLHAAPRACNPHHGLKVKTSGDVWIELNPEPRKIEAPPSARLLQPDSTPHEDMATGGLYSESELQAWKEHLEVSNYHEAVQQLVTYGVCVHRGDCQPSTHAPSFDLGNLQSVLPHLNLLTRAKELINSWATYICLIVILIELSKISIFIVVVVQTFLRNGLQETCAIMYLFCCAANRHARKIKGRKQRMPTAPEEGTEQARYENALVATSTTQGNWLTPHKAQGRVAG
jgi:hypothetical protein